MKEGRWGRDERCKGHYPHVDLSVTLPGVGQAFGQPGSAVSPPNPSPTAAYMWWGAEKEWGEKEKALMLHKH